MRKSFGRKLSTKWQYIQTSLKASPTKQLHFVLRAHEESGPLVEFVMKDRIKGEICHLWQRFCAEGKGEEFRKI